MEKTIPIFLVYIRIGYVLAKSLTGIRNPGSLTLNDVPGHIWSTGNIGAVDLHFLVQPVVEHQGMCHRKPYETRLSS